MVTRAVSAATEVRDADEKTYVRDRGRVAAARCFPRRHCSLRLGQSAGSQIPRFFRRSPRSEGKSAATQGSGRPRAGSGSRGNPRQDRGRSTCGNRRHASGALSAAPRGSHAERILTRCRDQPGNVDAREERNCARTCIPICWKRPALSEAGVCAGFLRAGHCHRPLRPV